VATSGGHDGHERYGSRWTRKASKLRGVTPLAAERLDELLGVPPRARRRRLRRENGVVQPKDGV